MCGAGRDLVTFACRIWLDRVPYVETKNTAPPRVPGNNTIFHVTAHGGVLIYAWRGKDQRNQQPVGETAGGYRGDRVVRVQL